MIKMKWRIIKKQKEKQSQQNIETMCNTIGHRVNANDCMKSG